jgi:hypothetical protein
MIAPIGSVTVPVIEPYSTCEEAQGLARSANARAISGAARRTRTVCEFVPRRKRLPVKQNKLHLVIIASKVVKIAVFSAGLLQAGTHTNRYPQQIE